jgi:protein ImuA
MACLTLPPNQSPLSHASNLSTLLENGSIWHGDPNLEAPLWKQPRTHQGVIPFGATKLDDNLPGGGLALGAVHEFFYNDPENSVSIPSTLPTLLARNLVTQHYSTPTNGWLPQHSTRTLPFLMMWIGKRCWPTPFLLDQEILGNCLFIDPPTQELLLWSVESALRSSVVKLVIVDCPRVSLNATRRLSLAARKSSSMCILLRDRKDQDLPSSAATKWRVSPFPSTTTWPTWKLDLLRSKGSHSDISSWIVSLESHYEEREMLSMRVLPPLVDGCNITSSYKEEGTERRFGT